VLDGGDMGRYGDQGFSLPFAEDAAFSDYVVGGFRIRARRPRCVYEALSGQNAWFANLMRFPTGRLICRINTTIDEIGGANSGRRLTSDDNGRTWANNATHAGLPSAGEPISVQTNGTLMGCDYAYFTPPVGVRSLQADKRVISADGLTLTTTVNGIQITGFPRDLRTYPSNPSFWAAQWYSDIVKVSAAQWISTIDVIYNGDPNYSAEVIESTDGGLNWAWVGSVIPTGIGGWEEGLVENSMIRLLDGDLMFISRNGPHELMRAFSSDLGRTWTGAARYPTPLTSPGIKAPRLMRLSSTNDYVILAGNADVYVPGMWPVLGLYLSTDPRATSWTRFDLSAHHNAYSTPEQWIGGVAQKGSPSGYMSAVELTPGKLLISYDRVPASYSENNDPNRVYVVEVEITRYP
jgi:hypothetical protein